MPQISSLPVSFSTIVLTTAAINFHRSDEQQYKISNENAERIFVCFTHLCTYIIRLKMDSIRPRNHSDRSYCTQNFKSGKMYHYPLTPPKNTNNTDTE